MSENADVPQDVPRDIQFHIQQIQSALGYVPGCHLPEESHRRQEAVALADTFSYLAVSLYTRAEEMK